MKFSFHTCGLERLHFEEAIIKLAEVGYAACGPIVGPGCHLDPFTITDSQKSSYRRLAEELKIHFCILNPWRVGDFVSGVPSGKTERFYTKALDLAADLGVPAVKFLSGSLASKKKTDLPMTMKMFRSFLLSGEIGMDENAGWQNMIKALRPLCRHAEQIGVDLLVQNHENELVDTLNGFALLRHYVNSERLQLNLDCGNLTILMVDPCKAIHEFKEHIRHVRIKGMKNYYPFALQCPPGIPGDVVNWEGVMVALKMVDYPGFIELVPYPWFPHDFPERALAWAISLAKKEITPPDEEKNSSNPENF